MRNILIAFVMLALCGLNAGDWRVDFKKGDPKENNFPVGWKSEGNLPGVPDSKVFVKDGVLRLECDKSSGGLIKTVEDVDLKKTPIMRWRWRAITLPAGADGRDVSRDDQAVGIYVGLPKFMHKNSVAYHYDTAAPKGEWGDTSYILGIVRVKFLTLRNQEDKLGEWYVEERNVAEDLKKYYGEIPGKFGLSLIANTHNTKTQAAAEVDYIEFVAPNTAKK